MLLSYVNQFFPVIHLIYYTNEIYDKFWIILRQIFKTIMVFNMKFVISNTCLFSKNISNFCQLQILEKSVLPTNSKLH